MFSLILCPSTIFFTIMLAFVAAREKKRKEEEKCTHEIFIFAIIL